MCGPYIAICPGIGYYQDSIKYCHNVISKFNDFEVRKNNRDNAYWEGNHQAPPHVTVCNNVDHKISEYHAHGIARTIRKYNTPPFHNGTEKGRDGKPKQTWELCKNCFNLIQTPLFGKVLDNFDPAWCTKSSSELVSRFEGIEETITIARDTSEDSNFTDSGTTHDTVADTTKVAVPRPLSTRNNHLKRRTDSIGSISDTTRTWQPKRIRASTLPYTHSEPPTSPQDVKAAEDAAAVLLQQYLKPTQDTPAQNSQTLLQRTAPLPQSTIPIPDPDLSTTLANRLTGLLNVSSTLHNQLTTHKPQLVSISHDLEQTLKPQSAVLENEIAALQDQLDGKKAKYADIQKRIQGRRQELKNKEETVMGVERKYSRTLEKISGIQRLLEVVDDDEDNENIE